MADKTLRGRFVWHELMTPDAAASHGFYSKALGWKSQAYDQDPSYNMFAAPSGPVGGTVAYTDGAPHWLSVIGTTDLEGTLRQATELGGKVVKDIAPAGNGRFALIADPQGATFGVYSNEQEPPAKDKPAKRGEFYWHELATTDVHAAFDFYSALFGWSKVREHDMGAEGVYLIFGRNNADLGGIWLKPASMQGPPNWLGYVRVKDVNPVVSKVKKAGGTLVHGPMEVPGGDWIAQFVDPQGALFAVLAKQVDMQPPASAQGSAAAEPVHASADSMAETTVLTDIPAPEAKVRSASKKPKSAAKPAPTKAATKKAGKKAATKKASKKAAAKKVAKKGGGKKKAGKKQVAKQAAKKKSAVRSAKKSARKAGKKKSVQKQKRAAKKGARKARKGK